MTSELEKQSTIFRNTDLLDIDSGKSNLAIDTMKEWTKGFVLINEIIFKLHESTYTEEFEDNVGKLRNRPKFHSLLLPFFKERRVLMDQYWKISGGEAVNEAKKEISKQLASTIFNFKLDEEANKVNRDKVIEMIEVDAVHKDEDFRS